MNIQRLLNMKPTELAFRSRQQAYKTFERLTTPDRETSPACLFASSATGSPELARIVAGLQRGDAAASADLQQRFWCLAPTRFFAGATTAFPEATNATADSAYRLQVLDGADAVCRGEFAILGYGRLSFGTPVDWHFEPLAGLKLSKQHWSRFDALDRSQVGDSKVVWELNRHQWLLELGQAWRWSGDPRYVQTAVRLLGEWMSANPPGYGINWASALEVSLRLMSWCWALFLFRGAAEFTPAFFLTMLGWLQAHARHIERFLSSYYSPNTHLTGEALGLFHAGTLFPELEGATSWRQTGHRILVEQMQRQVLADGVYFEQSTRYQHYTASMYLQFLVLAERNCITVPAAVPERLVLMVEFLLALRRPDGIVPEIGDADGGWLLPFIRRAPGDHRDLFATAAVVLGNSRFAWAAGELAPETRWLLGDTATRYWRSTNLQPPPPEPLRQFAEGGYVVMRSGWDRHAHHLVFDTGPLGCPVSSGHGHADLLAVQCSAFGEAYLVDPGTCCYTADPFWRDHFRSTRAHSTVLVDSRSQARPKGPFSWHDRPAAHLRACRSIDGLQLADAEHDAYRNLDNGVCHRRRVAFVDARYWVVVDDLEGTASHCIETIWQFAQLPLLREADDWVRALGRHSALLVRAFSASPLVKTIKSGEFAPVQGWISADYGLCSPAPVLVHAATAVLPLRMVTLLYPLATAGASAPQVEALLADTEPDDREAGSPTVIGLVIADGRPGTLRITNNDIFFQAARIH